MVRVSQTGGSFKIWFEAKVRVSSKKLGIQVLSFRPKFRFQIRVGNQEQDFQQRFVL